MHEAYAGFSGYHTLMRARVENILLVASPYDCFILEEDGHLADRVFSEYLSLNLSRHPRFTLVTTGAEAIEELEERRYDLVILTAYNRDMKPTQLVSAIKNTRTGLPVVMLTYDRGAAQSYADLGAESGLDGVYLWTGDPRLMLAVLKSVEDQLNAPRDTRKAQVRVIILVEDSPAFYSAYLPTIWTEVVKQTRSLTSQGLNDVHGRYRARARPKVLHARTYEEALELMDRYEDFLLGLITDMRFPREGRLDRTAGWKLVERARERNPDLPILIQSVETEHGQKAEEVGVAFVDKQSPQLLTALRNFMLNYLGFGPFIFRMPDGKVVARAHDMQEMLKALQDLPPESLAYHSEGYHFSNWLLARTEFVIAQQIRPWSVESVGGVEALREKLIDSFSEFEVGQQRGLVTDFVRGANPLYRDFTRIGSGSMGGKARSIAFASSVLAHSKIHEKYPDIRIYVPRTTVICSEVFSQYCERNQLRMRALEAETDEEVIELFMRQPLDPDLMDDLNALLSEVRYPLAVRSSSFSEDSAYQPLAGLFETVVLPNNARRTRDRLEQLSRAIRYVYASTFFQAPKTFMEAENVQAEAEQMAVAIQRLVGRSHEDRFYPDFAGVAQSHNYYPVGNLKAEDGLVTVALGLGSTVADGQRCLRFSPARPRVLPQMASPRYALRSSQMEFAALNMDQPTEWDPNIPSTKTYGLVQAEHDGSLEAVGATYVAADDRIYDTIYQPGVRIVNFSHVLKYDRFPLAPLIRELLELFKMGLGTEVELEFAVTLEGENEKAELALLQVRPLVARYDTSQVKLDGLDVGHQIMVEGPAIGHGVYRDIKDVVYVDPDEFEARHTRRMADAIGRLNKNLVHEGRPYLLLVPGRIGTEDPWLGIPVQWNQISGAKVMVELSTPNFWVDPSQGTHFFHNITSLRIGYFNVDVNLSLHTLDLDWLRAQDVAQSIDEVRHVKLHEPLAIRVDGDAGRGIIAAQLPDAPIDL